MGIQEEIHKAIKEIQEKLKANADLQESDLEKLLLTALIEEEA